MRIPIPSLFPALLIFFGSQLLPAQEVRTFTNQEGAKIEAKLVEILEDKSVRILRVSDDRVFTLPISSLSLEDQIYLAKELKKGSASTEHSLLVKLDDPGDRVYRYSSRSNIGSNSLGSHCLLTLAKGGWITYYSSKFRYSVQIPYYGEKLIEMYADSSEIRIKRDGGVPKLVAFRLPENDGSPNEVRRAFRSVDIESFAKVVNIIASSNAFEELDALPDDQAFSIRLYKPSSDLLRGLSRIKLVALDIEVDVDFLKDLESLNSLEYLNLEIEDADPADIVELPNLPNLKHLVLLNQTTNVNWDEALRKFPNLETLAMYRSGSDDGTNGTPITTFEANPNLRFLELNNSSTPLLDPEALASAKKLEYFGYLRRSLTDGLEPSHIEGHRFHSFKSYADTEFVEDHMDDWLASGAGAKLRELSIDRIPDFRHLQSLVSFKLTPYSSSTEPSDFSRFIHAPKSLMQLYLRGASNKDFETAAFPHPESIRSIYLSSGAIDDAELLYQFSNLEYLYLTSNSGRISSLDIAKFPKLQNLSIYNMDDLESLENISSSTSLALLYLYSNKYLSSLGQPFENKSLRRITLMRLPKLRNLEAFDQVTGATALYLREMDEIENYDKLEENNQLKTISIQKCEYLSDRSDYN